MAEDCEKLSINARKIFEKLKPYYLTDSWKNPRWLEVGGVYDCNEWFDLRKSKDRNKLIDDTIDTLGFFAEIKADIYQKKHGSLKGFAHQARFGRSMQNIAEKLKILRDLDFQIETMNLVESI